MHEISQQFNFEAPGSKCVGLNMPESLFPNDVRECHSVIKFLLLENSPIFHGDLQL